jgi:hypothetical protein
MQHGAASLDGLTGCYLKLQKFRGLPLIFHEISNPQKNTCHRVSDSKFNNMKIGDKEAYMDAHYYILY